jgi:signal transduction histidine kinase
MILILGAILLAFIYHVVLYQFNKDRLLIHYLLYIFFAGIFVFHRTYLVGIIFGEAVENYIYKYLNEPIQIIYLVSYFNFILQSIEVSKNKNSFLYRSWVFIMFLLIGYALTFYFSKIIFEFEHYPIAFFGIRVFIFFLTSVMLWQCFKLRHITFQLFILMGSSCYFIFGILSFISNLYLSNNMLIYPPEWLMIGSFVDIVFFSIAMSYRNKLQWENMNLTLLKDANDLIKMQKIVLEKQTALENERTRIAADMHDDLGSGLTKINYLSQMALLKNSNEEHLIKIHKTSSDLVGNMSEIIWAMKEDNNTIEDLVTYIKMYAVDYLDTNNLDYKITIPEIFDFTVIKGEKRRAIFLSVKEALHNIVKHAQATKVIFKIAFEYGLEIIIHDNGIGFDYEEIKNNHINGLINIKTRINSINGTTIIERNNGTSITLKIPKTEFDS